MQVIGTPRPSNTILGEVQDNGFFLKAEDEYVNNDDVSIIPAKKEDTPTLRYSRLEDNDEAAGGRARERGGTVESEEDVAEPPPISLTGQQPVLPKQYNIVTDLFSHCVQTQYYLENNSNPHLLPPHHFCKPGSANRAETDELAALERKQLEQEALLEQEESALLNKWRQGLCLGRPVLQDGGDNAQSKRRSTTAPAIVAAASPNISIATSNLLPIYEERVRILSLVGDSQSQRSQAAELSSLDFTVDNNSNGAMKRRVHCQIVQFTGPVDDTVFDSLAKTTDAIVVHQAFTEQVYAQLMRASHHAVVLVLTKQFGKTVLDAKKHAQKLGAHFCKTGEEYDIELAARIALVRMLKLRGTAETKPMLHLLEKQTRKLERRTSGTSSCAAM